MREKGREERREWGYCWREKKGRRKEYREQIGRKGEFGNNTCHKTAVNFAIPPGQAAIQTATPTHPNYHVHPTFALFSFLCLFYFIFLFIIINKQTNLTLASSVLLTTQHETHTWHNTARCKNNNNNIATTQPNDTHKGGEKERRYYYYYYYYFPLSRTALKLQNPVLELIRFSLI